MAAQSQHSYKLTYFDFRGRAELIRLLFAAAGQQFEDRRVSYPEFAGIKKSLPFGQLPTLHVDGHQFAQTFAIANFLSREFGFHGNDSLEALLIDQITQHVQDISGSVLKFFVEKDPALREKHRMEIKTEVTPKLLSPLETLLGKGTSGYFIRAEMTLADLTVCASLESLTQFGLVDLDPFPRLKTLVDLIHSHPRLAQYYATRKPDAYPIS